jgi:hypothetical protein
MSPVKEGVATGRTIVFSVHVPPIRPNVEIRCGARGDARLKTRTPAAGHDSLPRWLERYAWRRYSTTSPLYPRSAGVAWASTSKW